MRMFKVVALSIAGFVPLAGTAYCANDQTFSVAQSEGGSIGGSLDAPPTQRQPAQPPAASSPSKPRPVQQRPARPASAASFDGAWLVTSSACSGSGATQAQVTISGGRVISQGTVTGSVSPDGIVNTHSSYNGVSIVGSGRISGRAASGTYRQSDGCYGTWRAAKL